MEERGPYKAEVPGSIPGPPTILRPFVTNDFRIVPTQASRAAMAPAVEHAMKQATEHANATVAAWGFAKDSSARTDGLDADGP